MLSGTGDVCREFMCSERLKDEVEQLLKLPFSMFNQLLHSVSTYTHFSVAQIQVIIFDSHYSVVSQSDHRELLLILNYSITVHVYMYFIQFDIQRYVTFKHNTHRR